MRVVGGDAKGVPLKFPKSHHTRPTSDKVREAIFNVLGNVVVDSHVLDLYAGSGALAIEALSRGASKATIVESSRTACTVIHDNLRRTRFEGLATVLCARVDHALTHLEGPFQVILLDPPYADPGIQMVMQRLGNQAFLDLDGVLVLEHASRHGVASVYGTLNRWQLKRYGDTAVSFYDATGR